MSLVHHGYKRPGWGYILGDCFAVGWQPYELSTLVCSAWRDKMRSWLEATERTLMRLQDPGLETLYGTTSWLFPQALTKATAEKYRHHWQQEAAYFQEVKLWVRHDGNDEERQLFAKWRRQYIADAERDIGTARKEIERMEKFIDSWQLDNVRTEEEQVERDKAKKAAERMAKNAEKQADRDAKATKRRALDEKHDRWDKERGELIQMYRDLFTNLAKEPKHSGTGAAAREYWRAMQKAKNKKGYLHFYEAKLEIDDVLIQLGLAKKVLHGYVKHAYSDGYLP